MFRWWGFARNILKVETDRILKLYCVTERHLGRSKTVDHSTASTISPGPPHLLGGPAAPRGTFEDKSAAVVENTGSPHGARIKLLSC